MTGLERGVSELEVMAAMFAPFAIARSVLSKSAMRFMSCEIIASFSSTRLDMVDSCSLSLAFSFSNVDSNADEPNSKELGSRGMLLGVFELQVFPSKLAASSIVTPTSIGCCKWPKPRLLLDWDGTCISCGKQLGVVIAESCDSWLGVLSLSEYG